MAQIFYREQLAADEVDVTDLVSSLHSQMYLDFIDDAFSVLQTKRLAADREDKQFVVK